MQPTQAVSVTVLYLAKWLVATVVGGAIAVVGVAVGGLEPIGLAASTPVALEITSAYPWVGLAVIVLGGLVWKFGTALALVGAVGAVVEAETAATLNTEAMKSEILSVMDDRLADIYQEIEETHRLVDRMNREDAASEFEFSGVDRE